MEDSRGEIEPTSTHSDGPFTRLFPPPWGCVGETLGGRYRIVGTLGQGAMGYVYLADDLSTDERVAVKILKPDVASTPEGPDGMAREAVAARRIDHPNVAAAREFGLLEDGSPFLVLEYVDGIPLSDLIARGPVNAKKALRIAHQIASALVRAHSLGI